MRNAVLIGYGKMGQQIEKMMEADGEIQCVGVVDPMNAEMAQSLEALVEDLSERGQRVDVVIDFSHPDNLEMILRSVRNHPLPLVLATTGLTAEQIAAVEELSKRTPVLFSSNLSIGIAVMRRAVKEISRGLGDGFDIEIIEKHHNQKIDAPSGTARMLVDALDPQQRLARVYGREGYSKRGAEMGIHAVRGGSIAGEHTVIFAGENEVLEVMHRADSRQVFAAGAIRAAKYIAEKEAGLYDMDDVLFSDR